MKHLLERTVAPYRPILSLVIGEPIYRDMKEATDHHRL
jgi:hypothetical protein